jgi:hypothetical protein
VVPQADVVGEGPEAPLRHQAVDHVAQGPEVLLVETGRRRVRRLNLPRWWRDHEDGRGELRGRDTRQVGLMSERTEHKARVAGVQYLIIAVGWSGYAIGLLLMPGGSVGRVLLPLGVLTAVVAVSLRIPWSVGVDRRGVNLYLGPGGFVRIFVPKDNVYVAVVTRRDWGRRTHEVRLSYSDGPLQMVRWSTVANAPLGVHKDHGAEILSWFRFHDYRIEDEPGPV